MNEVKKHLKNLPILRNIVKTNDKSYFDNTVIPNNCIDENTITIVMTSSNRSEQVYYTLKTINHSSWKNVQLIIVDDSTFDPITVDRLNVFPFYIDFIRIKRDKKTWKNPCINYNIGFEYIKGSKVIIQNGEVCHIGDVLTHFNNIKDTQYYVYDIKAIGNLNLNKEIYKIDQLSVDDYNKPFYSKWYQHHRTLNRCLHFLTGMTYETFKKVQGFSYDYAFVSNYDDNDFLLKIRSNNIKLIPIDNEKHEVGGIHLFHTKLTHIMAPDAGPLFNYKSKYYNKFKKYLEISLVNDDEELLQRYNSLVGYKEI